MAFVAVAIECHANDPSPSVADQAEQISDLQIGQTLD
jgi:hypothetical protein